jgi:hypothetical protein
LQWGGHFSRRDFPHVQFFPSARDAELWAAHRAGTLDLLLGAA